MFRLCSPPRALKPAADPLCYDIYRISERSFINGLFAVLAGTAAIAGASVEGRAVGETCKRLVPQGVSGKSLCEWGRSSVG
jgi:hypothetical protein